MYLRITLLLHDGCSSNSWATSSRHCHVYIPCGVAIILCDNDYVNILIFQLQQSKSMIPMILLASNTKERNHVLLFMRYLHCLLANCLGQVQVLLNYIRPFRGQRYYWEKRLSGVCCPSTVSRRIQSFGIQTTLLCLSYPNLDIIHFTLMLIIISKQKDQNNQI